MFIFASLFWHIPCVKAGDLTDMSISLADQRPNNTTNVTVNFKPATTNTLKRINFYFVRATDNSNEPVTQDLTGVSLSSVSGLTWGNWNLDTSGSSNGSLYLKYTDGEQVNSGTSVSVTFASMHMAELGDCTVNDMIYDNCWVNIITYSDDGNTIVDNGGVGYMIQDTPELTFNITGVASDVIVNGITTTKASNYNEIDFGVLNINTPVFMSHKLFVKTTAPHGYVVTMKLDGYIQGLDPNNQITPFLPTNGAWNSPQEWESPEGDTNSDSGWIGANITDGRVDDYLNLYQIWSAGNGSGKFGPVSSTAHPVMYSGERDRDGSEEYTTFGIEVNENQLPDSYAGTLIYNIFVTY